MCIRDSSSVYEPGAPQVGPAIFEAGIPAFGMCYGFQAMALALGGEVRRTGASEYGRTPVTVTDPGTLLADVPTNHRVWICLLYTSDAADDLTRVDLGCR